MHMQISLSHFHMSTYYFLIGKYYFHMGKEYFHLRFIGHSITTKIQWTFGEKDITTASLRFQMYSFALSIHIT